jgi:hypothetical protein
MNRQSVKLLVIISIFAAVAAVSVAASSVESPQKTGNDFKITEKTTMSGQTYQNTIMIKGARERRESHLGAGMTMVNITQCDLRRTIQVNDRGRMYMITPIEAYESESNDRAVATSAGASEAQRGGLVTYNTTVTDTGERKEMFGFTARHLKSTMSTELSPDACTEQKMRIDRDGWYIDLNYEFSCGFDGPAPQMGMRTPHGGCQDRIRFKRSGRGKLGYAVQETTTMYGPNGEVTYTTTKEVIELSRQPLDAALFDVPAGYSEAKNQQEMYGMPSVGESMNISGQRDDENPNSQSRMDTGRATSVGMKIGVVQFNNKANASVSMDDLRDRLVSEINSSGIEAIALNASSLGEAQIEAKAKQCSYILLTDVSTLKTASAGKKLGGILGRAAGVDTGGAGKSEAKLEFKLYPTESPKPVLDSSASSKEDTQDASIGAVLNREAQSVAAAVRKP